MGIVGELAWGVSSYHLCIQKAWNERDPEALPEKVSTMKRPPDRAAKLQGHSEDPEPACHCFVAVTAAC